MFFSELATKSPSGELGQAIAGEGVAGTAGTSLGSWGQSPPQGGPQGLTGTGETGYQSEFVESGL